MALISAAVLLLFLVSCSARDFTFTFKLGAGKSECFYDYIHEGAFLEVEFQVSCEWFGDSLARQTLTCESLACETSLETYW